MKWSLVLVNLNVFKQILHSIFCCLLHTWIFKCLTIQQKLMVNWPNTNGEWLLCAVLTGVWGRGDMVGFDPGAKGAAHHPEEAALAGSAAGMVTRAIISPLDVLKIRFQVMDVAECFVWEVVNQLLQEERSAGHHPLWADLYNNEISC